VSDHTTDNDVPTDPYVWVQATAPVAVAYAASLLHDRGAAEDVVQDCFCRLLEKANVYDLPNDGRRLLFRSVTNACFNRLRRQRPILRLYGEDNARLVDCVTDVGAEVPERVLMRRELEDAIAAGLQSLPTLQRAALELKSLGHSLRDIADTLSISSGNAGVLIHRARQAMAQCLAPFLEERSG
jgi:RNA polymerase sigma factor (sigma-70 family)